MKFEKFLAKKSLTKNDLFGDWVQKGVDFNDPNAGKIAAQKLQWMRSRVKYMINAKEITIPRDAICTFKRCAMMPLKIAEVMNIHADNKLIHTIVCGCGEFHIDGENLEPTFATKASVKTKHDKKPAESGRPSTPNVSTSDDGRHVDGKGWTNKKLQSELIAKA